jgi:uncharacterized protein YciI
VPRRLLALFYDYVEDVLERRAPHREAHLAHVESWTREGGIVMAGALGDPPHGALFVFDADEPAIEEFVRSDPYVEAGIVDAHRVEPWTVVAERAR